MNTTTRETTIAADPNAPTIIITREFDAPPERVFRAHVEPELVRRWLGPRGLEMDIERFDCETGGAYRYTHRDENGEYKFYGSFHEVRPNQRIVQTFTDLGDGRTRIEALSFYDSTETRDLVLSSGMDHGVREGYERLDELLAG